VYTVHEDEGGSWSSSGTRRRPSRISRKHGVEFIDAVIVFDDDLAITLMDEHPTEERYLTLAWTLRDGYWRFIRGK
jgi:uncharacterized DUF497 family protein